MVFQIRTEKGQVNPDISRLEEPVLLFMSVVGKLNMIGDDISAYNHIKRPSKTSDAARMRL